MTADSDSEFGYDFSAEEEELLLQLASPCSPQVPQTQILPGNDARLAEIDANSNKQEISSGHHESLLNCGASPVLNLDSLQTSSSMLNLVQPIGADFSSSEQDQQGQQGKPVVCYPDLSSALSRVGAQSEVPVAAEQDVQGEETAKNETPEDDRSPLQRFRSYPRRPLTVSDLTAGAWCELQYWYTLTRLPGGRRTRTKAMKMGTKVHQKLEDEVHTTVKIDIMSKEDGFGLRLWNFVQGLRTLRDTGLTRELEVWGMVDDNLVNGVIDDVSYENPNPEFEADLSSQGSQGEHRQSLLNDYFPPSQANQASYSSPKIYLADVKTRGSLAPVSNTSLRPAKIQLLLYHRFLSDMAAGRLNFLGVFRQYGLSPDEPFSDAFIAQIGSLHDEIFIDAPPDLQDELLPTESTNDAALSGFQPSSESNEPDLLRYRTLRELLSLVQDELSATFPHGEHSMGHMLRVQYVHRQDGREIQVHDFPVSRQALDDYLTKYMAWWRGERQARGVEIEEAFKCRTCEFASDCSWRQDMDEGWLRRAQAKVQAGRASRH
ncbi:exonuclease V [Mariannaea sp. PMI_226]|nr:exonuclease V [Mariannaea sp. PMI_226]